MASLPARVKSETERTADNVYRKQLRAVKKEVMDNASAEGKMDDGRVKETVDDRLKRIGAYGKERAAKLHAWLAQKNFASKNMKELEERYKAFIKEDPAFGTTQAMMDKRRILAKRGDVTPLGGDGVFRPYRIINGTITGGLVARGRDVIVDNKPAYAIPITPTGDSRKLESLRATYSDPTKVPAKRQIKFIRGHWGGAANKTSALNRIW